MERGGCSLDVEQLNRYAYLVCVCWCLRDLCNYFTIPSLHSAGREGSKEQLL